MSTEKVRVSRSEGRMEKIGSVLNENMICDNILRRRCTCHPDSEDFDSYYRHTHIFKFIMLSLLMSSSKKRAVMLRSRGKSFRPAGVRHTPKPAKPHRATLGYEASLLQPRRKTSSPKHIARLGVALPRVTYQHLSMFLNSPASASLWPSSR